MRWKSWGIDDDVQEACDLNVYGWLKVLMLLLFVFVKTESVLVESADVLGLKQLQFTH